MAAAVTWYDILGVVPGASADRIRRAYEDRLRLLAMSDLVGAPPEVIGVAAQARDMLDMAWSMLSDPATRERYGERAGLAGTQDGPVVSTAAYAPIAVGSGRSGFLSAIADAVAEWLAPKRRPPRWVTVPAVMGLFFSSCAEVATRAGLRVRAVRLTEHPRPVDGLVVGQEPPPGRSVARLSTLQVTVWHPRRADDRG